MRDLSGPPESQLRIELPRKMETPRKARLLLMWSFPFQNKTALSPARNQVVLSGACGELTSSLRSSCQAYQAVGILVKKMAMCLG
jgi:hypothetical protein